MGGGLAPRLRCFRHDGGFGDVCDLSHWSYTDSKCSRHLSSDCDRVKPIYWKVTRSELTLRCFGGDPGGLGLARWFGGVGLAELPLPCGFSSNDF